MTEKGYARLSAHGRYTKFSYEDMVITFMHGKDLIRYLAVKEWDNGYLVVMAKNKTKKEAQEDYIDLLPILENLYMNPEEFLRPIKGVELDYV